MENLTIKDIAERLDNMEKGILELQIGNSNLEVFIENSRLIVQHKFKSPKEVIEFVKMMIAFEKLMNQ